MPLPYRNNVTYRSVFQYDGAPETFADSDSGTGTDTATLTVKVGSEAYESVVTGDSPTGYWRLGEKTGTTAVDVTGSNNATYIGTTNLDVTGAISGDTNTAMSSASNGAIQVGSEIRSTPSSGSIEVWVNTDGWSLGDSGHGVYQNVAPGSWSNRAGSIGLFKWTNDRFYFRVVTDNATLYDLSQDPWTDWINLNGWNHLVLTFESNGLMIAYVNGEEVDRRSIAALTAFPTNGDTLFGRGHDRTADGTSYDEPAVYDDVLTPAEVAEHYDAGVNRQFDNGTPTETATDPDAALSATDARTAVDTVDLIAANLFVSLDATSASDSEVVAVVAADDDAVSAFDSEALAELTNDLGATGTDNATLAVQVSDTESGTATDTAALTVQFTDTDSGSGTDVATPPSAGITNTENGTGNDAAALAVALTNTDAGASAGEVAALTVDDQVTDSGVGTDTADFVVSFNETDSGTAVEAEQDPAVVIPVSDSGVGNDVTVAPPASIPNSDSGTAADAEAINKQVTETGTATDVANLVVVLADSEAITSADNATLDADIINVATDSGAGVDNAALTVAASDTETGTATDNNENVALTNEDSGTSTELEALAAAFADTESGTAIDNADLAAAFSDTDAATGADAQAVEKEVFLAASHVVILDNLDRLVYDTQSLEPV